MPYAHMEDIDQSAQPYTDALANGDASDAEKCQGHQIREIQRHVEK